jgi:YVTN family beta-propeller protein
MLLEFRILGPLEVVEGDRTFLLGRGKQRALLAFLVLHANEVVPVDKLVDELWGEVAPSSATKIVQNYVSQLRQSLADGTPLLHTRGAGYVLELQAGQLDVDRFEQLLDEGRRALGSGDSSKASVAFREALGIWRGPALADFTYEAFAQSEIARLEERRLLALEDRIEADLALGRHADLVPELEACIARHPLRERLRGQLMLALYRSGRQAEALQVYADTRRVLVDELGLEPGKDLRGLEGQILRHDPALELPAHRSAKPPRIESKRRRRAGLVAATLVILAAAGAAVLLLLRSEPAATPEPAGAADSTAAVPVPPNSVAIIDPRTNAVVASVPVGAHPVSIVVGESAVWVANVDDQTVMRIDPETRKVVKTIGLGIEPTGLAVGDGAVWVAGGFDHALLRIDTSDNLVRERLTIEPRVGSLPEGYERGPSAVTVGEGAVWLAHGQEVTRIDPATGTVEARIGAGGSWSGAVAAGEGAVWTIDNGARPGRQERPGVDRIRPRTNSVVATVPFSTPPRAQTAIAVGEGAVWATTTVGDEVWKIDPRANLVSRIIPAGDSPIALALGEGGLWVADEEVRTVSRIDPYRGMLVATIELPHELDGIAAGEGAVWVSVGTP